MYRTRNSVRALLVLSLLATFFAVQEAAAHSASVKGIEVENPWSRATPGMSEVGAGYATIKNSSETPDRLISVATEVSAKAEVHELTMANGVMKMRPLPDGLEVPAKGEVDLKPGSYHLMLMGLKKPLKEGERFSGTLTFEHAGPIEVMFDVKGIGAPGPDHAH